MEKKKKVYCVFSSRVSLPSVSGQSRAMASARMVLGPLLLSLCCVGKVSDCFLNTHASSPRISATNSSGQRSFCPGVNTEPPYIIKLRIQCLLSTHSEVYYCPLPDSGPWQKSGWRKGCQSWRMGGGSVKSCLLDTAREI